MATSLYFYNVVHIIHLVLQTFMMTYSAPGCEISITDPFAIYLRLNFKIAGGIIYAIADGFFGLLNSFRNKGEARRLSSSKPAQSILLLIRRPSKAI